jgi:hypothetical protein
MPEAHDDESLRDAGRQISGAGPDRRAGDERHALLQVVGRVLSTPGTMIRALVFVSVLLALVLVAAGLLGVKVDVGPVHVGPAAAVGGE